MDLFSIEFPKGAVVCTTGDYLICRHSATKWQVYRVEDILLARRLIPFQNDISTLVIEEHMSDSKIPAYFNEVQLLLTEVGPDFPDQSIALQAIRLQTLNERVKGLLRPAREFTEQDCKVVRKANKQAI